MTQEDQDKIIKLIIKEYNISHELARYILKKSDELAEDIIEAHNYKLTDADIKRGLEKMNKNSCYGTGTIYVEEE